MAKQETDVNLYSTILGQKTTNPEEDPKKRKPNTRTKTGHRLMVAVIVAVYRTYQWESADRIIKTV
jgi:hypothetical protein